MAAAGPHPVQLNVPYPERLSRWLLFVKWILAVPHFIVLFALSFALLLLTVIAWFAILFTGRYPRGFHDFTTGILRWSANVFAYVAFLRDEYPPFSTDEGQYPLGLDVPYAPRQSRVRLFVRWATLPPQIIVFYFVQLAAFFTTFIAWWGILFSGRYPRGLFKFNVGVMRWWLRLTAYQYLLRDEYPPYSVNANARPGNEWLAGIIGAPLGVAYVALTFAPSLIFFGTDRDVVRVNVSLAEDPGALERIHPAGEANGLRITLTGYDDDALAPPGSDYDPPLGTRLVSFDVEVNREGPWPRVYLPFLFVVDNCFGLDDDYVGGIETGPTFEDSPLFDLLVFDDHAGGTVYFQVGRLTDICSLEYSTGGGGIEFRFRP